MKRDDPGRNTMNPTTQAIAPARRTPTIVVLAWVFILLLMVLQARAQNISLRSELPAPEYQALVDLYNSADGASWSSQSGWTNANASSIYGVTVAGGHVTRIALGGNNMAGVMPESLGSLTNLQYLNLDGNSFTGAIPASLGSLANLRFLDLHDNFLTGAIPTSLGNLSFLTTLFLQDNLLDGAIPDSSGGLGQLQTLQLAGNALTGAIPPSMGNLTNLQNLGLEQNALIGAIPDSLGNLSALTVIHLENNQLSGPIPASLAGLSKLVQLSVSGNQLTGEIPAGLGSITGLVILNLGGNQLSGGVPTGLGNLTHPLSIDLSKNQLIGDAPDFSGWAGVTLNLVGNYLNTTPGSGSRSNIQAMITRGNTVLYSPQSVPPAPVAGPVVLRAGGSAQVGLTGVPGLKYTLEVSSDLFEWSSLTQLVLTNSGGQVLDASASNQPRRFYRALFSP